MYISVAWSLIISYQLFTQIAVYSIVHLLNGHLPSAAELLTSRIDTIVFIHAFAWIFVLSSVIPSIILGKGRSVLLQFFLCLTVTFVAISVEDILTLVLGTQPTVQMQTLSIWFQNPVIAGVYLSAPYVSMLYLDIRSKRKSEKEESHETETTISEDITSTEQEVSHKVTSGEANVTKDANLLSTVKRKANFLYGTALLCFALALATFWFDKIIISSLLTQSYKLLYVMVFTFLGLVLTALGYYTTSSAE